MMRSYPLAVFGICLALITGCQSVGPDFHPPKIKTPATYRFAGDGVKAVDDLKWWELFDDPVLHELVRQALENNRDLKTAMARIEEARATYGMTRADEYPAIEIGAGAYHGNYSSSRSRNNNSNLYLTPVLSWELDFWGKFKRASAAARAEILASRYGARAAQVSLIAEVASAYYQLLDYRQRLAMSKETLASRKDSLSLMEKRLEKGIIPEIDVNQAQIEMETAAGAIPQYERLIAKTENALGLLLGQLPGRIPMGAALEDQHLPPFVPVLLPSVLLKRRPDIQQSLALLHAKNENIGVAVAQRFPALSLSSTLGLALSRISGTNIQGGAWNGNASLLGPLFDFKKSLHRVEVAESQTRQALTDYENTVLTAFREAEDALVSIDTYRRESEAAQRKVVAAQKASQLSFKRYDKGVSSYLEALDAQRTLFSARLADSETKQLYFNAYVVLYKAMGGGWINPEQKPLDVQNFEETSTGP